MRRLCVVLATITLGACGGEAPRAGLAPASLPDGGTVVVPPPSDAAAEPRSDELQFVDEPDTACDAFSGHATPLAAEGISLVGRMGHVGSRRWLADAYGRSVVLLAENGVGTWIHLGTDHQADSAAGLLGVLGSGGGATVYARYAPNGTVLGTTVVSDVEPFATMVGHGTSHALVAFATGTALRARSVDVQGGTGPIFDLEVAAQSEVSGSIVGQGTSFAIAWSVRRTADGRWRTYFVRATTTEKAGLTRLLHASESPHSVSRLVRRGDGFALLMNVDGHATLATLDALGRPRGPARRLLGTDAPLDLAAHGGDVAVVARRTDGTIAVRVFDELARPLANGSCTERLPEGEERGGAIDDDGSGWAFVARGADGLQHLRLLDHLGRARTAP